VIRERFWGFLTEPVRKSVSLCCDTLDVAKASFTNRKREKDAI
jgi:hypothetical protein